MQTATLTLGPFLQIAGIVLFAACLVACAFRLARLARQHLVPYKNRFMNWAMVQFSGDYAKAKKAYEEKFSEGFACADQGDLDRFFSKMLRDPQLTKTGPTQQDPRIILSQKFGNHQVEIIFLDPGKVMLESLTLAYDLPTERVTLANKCFNRLFQTGSS